jgi:hypothetical protein
VTRCHAAKRGRLRGRSRWMNCSTRAATSVRVSFYGSSGSARTARRSAAGPVSFVRLLLCSGCQESGPSPPDRAWRDLYGNRCAKDDRVLAVAVIQRHAGPALFEKRSDLVVLLPNTVVAACFLLFYLCLRVRAGTRFASTAA